jgi:hypothetical protein
VSPATDVTRSAALDLTAPGPAFVAMSRLSIIPAGGDTPPVPSLPKTPNRSDPACAQTEGALIAAVFAAKRPLAPRSGAAVSIPPNAAIPPAAYRYFRNVHV